MNSQDNNAHHIDPTIKSINKILHSTIIITAIINLIMFIFGFKNDQLFTISIFSFGVAAIAQYHLPIKKNKKGYGFTIYMFGIFILFAVTYRVILVPLFP